MSSRTVLMPDRPFRQEMKAMRVELVNADPIVSGTSTAIVITSSSGSTL